LGEYQLISMSVSNVSGKWLHHRLGAVVKTMDMTVHSRRKLTLA